MPAEIDAIIDKQSIIHWVRHLYTRKPEVFQQFLSESGEILRSEMQATAPRRTGALAESITVQRGADYVHVGPTVPYAIFVEFGVRPHKIVPRHAQALRFEVDGHVVFAKHVCHPGFKGRFFVQRAVDQATPRIRERAMSIFQTLYGGVTPRVRVAA